MNILLIEDDAGLVDLVSLILEESGFFVMSAASGAEALAYLDNNTPDMMLLDYSLPDINGNELIEMLNKKQRPIPPFILTTGQGDERIVVNMMKLGAKDYVIKDILYLEKLPEVVNRVIKEIRNDIKLKQAEEALKESETKFNLIFQNNPSPVALIDASNLTFTDVNKIFTKVTGFTHDDAIGKTSYELGIFRDKIVEDGLAKMLENDGHFKNAEITIYTKEGVKLDGLNFGESIVIDDKKYYLITLIDITEQKQNQQQLGFLLTLQNKLRDFSTDLINIESDKISEYFNEILKEIGQLYGADRAYVFEYDFTNNTATEKYEWSAEGIEPQIDKYQKFDLSNSSTWIIDHKAGRPTRVSSLDDEPDGDIKAALVELKTKSILTVPTFIEDNLMGFVGIDYVKNEHTIKDIDVEIMSFFGQIYTNTMARIRSEDKLKELNKQLTKKTIIANEYAEKSKKANKAKSEFLAGMSHEIRTPLNGVIGFTDLLADTELNVTQRHYIKNANKSAHSLLSIINDILDFSKIEAGKLELEYIECEIYQLFDEIIELFKMKTSKKGIELFVDIDLNLPQTIIIDAGRFRQVLVNLLANSVKFTDKGNIRLVVGFEEVNGKGILSVKILDSGVGIDPDQKSKLFKAFSQADASVTRKFGGTGLGLIISNNIIHQMGGNIEFSSIPNVLTTFEFSLELDFIKDEKFNQEMTKNISKILMITKDTHKIPSTRRMLAFWEYNLTLVNNFNEADEALNKEKFDLIFVGYVLSSYEDFNDLSIIKKDLDVSKTPILLVDEVISNRDLRDACEKLDIGYFISKPIRQTNLLKKLIYIDKNFMTGFKPQSSPTRVKKEHKILSLKEYNILIAEDNKLNLRLLTTILQKLLPNMKLDSALNGKIAKEKALKNSYDIILMDLQMPEMDGITSTKAIIEALKSKAPPIIAVTANTTVEDRTRCLSAGMSGFLTKPIVKKDLIAALRSNLIKE